MEFVCNECGASFTKNKNLLRHVREKRQGKKRTDNEKRKSEIAVPKIVNISTDEAREPCTDIRTCGEPGLEIQTCQESVVGCVPQVAFKSPKEYVTLAMEAHREDRQLTSQEFMQANELSVFKCITDIFWTALYERPDLDVYVTDDVVSWLEL